MVSNRWLGVLATGLILAGTSCSPDTPDALSGILEPSDVLVVPSVTVRVCKYAWAASAGLPDDGTVGRTFEFKTTSTNPDADVTSPVSLAASGTDDDPAACTTVFELFGTSFDDQTDVSVSELVPDGFNVKRIVVESADPSVIDDPDDPGVTIKPLGGATVKFYDAAVPVCEDVNADNYGGALPCTYPPCPAGSFTFSFNPAGDLVIVYDQFPAPNDNSYGVNAVGWPKGHKFSDLRGSDHAGFQLLDGNGKTQLSFNVDYITEDASAPSGYASLGVTGGDGKMLVGTPDGITATTSLANNLNNINIPGLFNASHVQQFGSVNVLVDSPPTDPAHQTYAISDPTLAGWDFHNTYYVTVSAAKLAALGFDPATWQVLPNADQLHNSPHKDCPVPAGSCSVSVMKTEFKDRDVKITLVNDGPSDVYLDELLLTWPDAVNGKLKAVKLGKDVIYDKPDIAGGSADLTSDLLTKDEKRRKIPHGKSKTLTLQFERKADTNPASYALTASFGECDVTIFP